MKKLDTFKSPLNKVTSTEWLFCLFFTSLMSFTRFYHGDNVWNLPDASLAVFFLCGHFLNSALFLLWFLVEACLIDLVSIYGFGVSSYCLSPAYFFLIPAFSCAWMIGKKSKPFIHLDSSSTTLQLGIAVFSLLSATTLAACIYFLISNISFFLFSGQFSHLTLQTYFTKVAMYFPAYWLSLMGYTVSFIACRQALIMARYAAR